MDSVAQPAVADMEALDRGVIEAGVTAAQALAAQADLSRRLAAIERFLGITPAKPATPQPSAPRGRHLYLLPPPA